MDVTGTRMSTAVEEQKTSCAQLCRFVYLELPLSPSPTMPSQLTWDERLPVELWHAVLDLESPVQVQL
jgi:hypothetical protein